MPVGSGGKWYNDPERAQLAELSPAVYTSTFTQTAWGTEDYDTVMALLNTHAFLRTAHAGANNDLDFIARDSGVAASATGSTTMTGANNDITFTAFAAGSSYNGVRIRIVDTTGEKSNTLSVRTTGREVAIYPATNAAGVITSTSSQVQTAFAADTAAAALATAANKGGDNGSGVVTGYDSVVLSGGSVGTGITISFVVAGNNTALSIGGTGLAIIINVATGGGGAATSTSAQVKAAIEADARASSLVVVNHQTGNDGTGVVAALGSTALGTWTGTTPTLDVKLETSVDGTNYFQVSTAFGQKTTIAAAEGRAFAPLANFSRWVCTIAGTTPIMAFSISATDRK
jgi:hypothetical protein